MIHLTREVRFAVDRDRDSDAVLASSVSNAWAGWPDASILAPYLKLQTTVAGEPDTVTGYLCDIRHIDDLLRSCAVPLALNPAVPLTTERFLHAVWKSIAHRIPGGATLVQLRLFPTPYIHYTIRREDPEMIQVTEQFEFAAAHRLHCPELTEGENRELFGKCNNLRGHGHNYVLEVTVAGRLDASGLVCSRQRLERIVKERVLDRFDHKHLNEDTEEFRDLNPTVENIARVVWGLLAARLRPARLTCVRVYETPKTWADCSEDS
jgi:6-pyruvoyltetrahydropterin/6-carboxytetrahydropterin synthase